jgi:hypothetical protein
MIGFMRVIGRTRRAGLVLLLIVAVSMFVPTVRSTLLVTLGRALVADDSIMPVDVIVIAPDAAEAGVLEAADLVQHGISDRVAVLSRPVTPLSAHFKQRGVPYADEGERYLGLLHALRIEQVEIVRMREGGTEEAGEFLPEWSRQRQFSSVLVVTGTDHSRRIRRVLRRNSSGHNPSFTVRRSRYSAFTPERWWWHRGTIRTGLIELQKLALDVLLHPLSW